MSAATLFGLALAPLYAAIAQVESDDGKTSENIYQIDEGVSDTAIGSYVCDVNRIVLRLAKEGRWRTTPKFTHEDVMSRVRSERMMLYYWFWWGREYQKKTGRKVSYEILARIHNGGPIGWKKEGTVKYWNKVRNELLKKGIDK